MAAAAQPGVGKLTETMFASAATRELPLARAMRFLPHTQDTGGFFVAVLDKVAECSALANTHAPLTAEAVAKAASVAARAPPSSDVAAASELLSHKARSPGSQRGARTQSVSPLAHRRRSAVLCSMCRAVVLRRLCRSGAGDLRMSCPPSLHS